MTSPPAARSATDDAVRIAFPYVVGGLAAAPVLLAISVTWSRFATFLIHLSAVVALGLLAAWRLAALVHAPWYPSMGWTPANRRLAGGVTMVVIVTGVVGLVTLATAAALRFQPSLQFLSFLSALDIAWAGAAIVFGAQRRWGRRAALVGGTLLGVFCVASIWIYLRVVGLGPAGEWQVVGAELTRLVLPFDMVAAVVAGVLLWTGMRPDQATLQASDQS